MWKGNETSIAVRRKPLLILFFFPLDVYFQFADRRKREFKGITVVENAPGSAAAPSHIEVARDAGKWQIIATRTKSGTLIVNIDYCCSPL